ncbi:MAG: metallophosphoesterase [Terrisporobacter sp.]|uniref:metallophosphoesterase family protein n=1 Tax=Terrisporobacter sp. TaxID=1965305 RepID=UPI002FC7C5DB
MKIGIISDTHGDMKSIEKVIPYLKECSLIIHAGDYIDDAEYIYYATDVNVKSVKGNCDLYTINGEYELIFSVGGKKFFLCHGHDYNVKIGVNSLLKIAKDKDIDIVIFGHSHIPVFEKVNNVLFINPGSLAYPRGGSQKTFGILTIGEELSYEEVRI